MNIQIIRSKRKSISIEITKDLLVFVRAPIIMSDKMIAEFIEQKRKWIDNHMELMQIRNEKNSDIDKFTDAEIRSITEKAYELIPQRAAYFSQIMNVGYGKITIRHQKSRWGSCSSQGNLNFNCLLMLTPPEVTDYVVVHELCHRKEMNHSVKFWNEVKKILPDYELQKKWLTKYGAELILRLKNTAKPTVDLQQR